MTVLIAYLALGACAGLLAGLFGIGGGLIIVPALILSFDFGGVSSEIATHLAVGTSLATIVATSVSSVRTHHLHGAVLWQLFRPVAVGLVAGSVIGVWTAASLQGPMLRLVIGCFAIIIGIQMALAIKPKPQRQLPDAGGLVLAGSGIGWASAIFGIGGGSLSVPYLTWCNVRMQQAVATSAAFGLPIAVAGALTNIVEGWGHPALPGGSLGFVYLPAFAGIVLCSVPMARVGARLAHKLPATTLKRAFSLLLFVIGARFIWQSLPEVFT